MAIQPTKFFIFSPSLKIKKNNHVGPKSASFCMFKSAYLTDASRAISVQVKRRLEILLTVVEDLCNWSFLSFVNQ